MEAKTREYFNGVAPKRHTKPQRSEFSAHYLDKVTGEDDYIPELAEFQRLESDPHEVSFLVNHRFDSLGL